MMRMMEQHEEGEDAELAEGEGHNSTIINSSQNTSLEDNFIVEGD